MNTKPQTDALRLLTTGTYVVTSSNDGSVGAATVPWLSQASSRPPLIMAAIPPNSDLFKCLSESRVAAVHILDAGQKEIANRFILPARIVRGTISGEPFRRGLTRAPILLNARAHVECVVRQIVRLGDHAIVILEVLEATCRPEIRAVADLRQ